jgi:hypothetical protein
MRAAGIAIVTTGVVGLGTPAISAYFQRLRDRDAARRERQSKDRDELRGLLDEATAAMHEWTEDLISLEHWMQLRTFGLPRSKRASELDPGKRADLATLEARLVIRRGRGDVLVSAFRDYIETTDAGKSEIDASWFQDEPFDCSDDQLAERAECYRARFGVFVDKSREIVARL